MALAGGVVDDLVGEVVAGVVQRVGLEALAQLGLERGQVGELAHRPGELVVGLGQGLAAQLLDRDREVGLLAAQRLFLVVLGEDDVELALVALRGAQEMVLEARDEPILAQDQRHALRRAAVEGRRRRACRRRR